MKQFFLISLILFFHFFIYAQQPKITDIVWKGTNNEYLQILKKEAGLNKGQHFQEFAVIKYVKNSYIVLASPHISGLYWQQYDIVRFTKDTLILAPVGRDVFKLSQPNEDNQYVFVNSLNGFTFTKLHFTTSLVAPELDLNLSITLTIDSTKKSFVKLHDDYMNETNVVTTSMGKHEYKTLITILAGLDISNLPKNLPDSYLNSLPKYFIYAQLECCNSFFEVRYNDQVETYKGCTSIPFYHPALAPFLINYIAKKSAQSGRMPRLW